MATKRLKEQVKRNSGRFPEYFMFELTSKENEFLRSQNATLKRGAHSKYLPYAFTEHGVLMLANVLKGRRAIQTSLMIIEVFVKLREWLSSQKDILIRLEKLEKELVRNNGDISTIFRVLKELIRSAPVKPPSKIGFQLPGKEK
jgi:phage regulator Rha-like protein